MNLREEINKLKDEGYSQQNAQARICQDIILEAISKCHLNENVTIKGGVVSRMERILSNKIFISNIKTSKKNWLDLSLDEVLKKDLEFIRNLKV